MRRAFFLIGILATVLCNTASVAAEVAPADYDSFWLWGGVTPSSAMAPVLAKARTLYILQGEIRRPRQGKIADLHAQGISVPRLRNEAIWLVYRTDTLQWPERIAALMNARVARWRAAGNQVAGIQIDFDAATGRLATYAGFLKQLRAQLRPDCRLGITGLLDWSGRIDPATLNDLKGTIDELVIQTYQGRQTIANYAAYLPHLERLTLPFKVGLVEAGDWTPPPDLTDNPWFGGYVVFLVNRK